MKQISTLQKFAQPIFQRSWPRMNEINSFLSTVIDQYNLNQVYHGTKCFLRLLFKDNGSAWKVSWDDQILIKNKPWNYENSNKFLQNFVERWGLVIIIKNINWKEINICLETFENVLCSSIIISKNFSIPIISWCQQVNDSPELSRIVTIRISKRFLRQRGKILNFGAEI